MKVRRSYVRNLTSCEKKAWKKSGLNVIWTHDLCDTGTGAVLYQLSNQANWELVILWVGKKPVDDEYMPMNIWNIICLNCGWNI